MVVVVFGPFLIKECGICRVLVGLCQELSERICRVLVGLCQELSEPSWKQLVGKFSGAPFHLYMLILARDMQEAFRTLKA